MLGIILRVVSAARSTGDFEQDKYITQFSRVNGTPENLTKVMLNCFWSPCIWRNNQRLVANFEFADFCALDFETPFFTLTDAIRSFCDMWHIIGTTSNHQKPKDGNLAVDRFRVLIPWEQRIEDAYTYKYNMKKLAEKWDADTSATSAQHPFRVCTEIVSTNFDEDLFLMQWEEIDEEKDNLEKFLKKEKNRHRKGILSMKTQMALTEIVLPGSRHDVFFKVACELARAGLSLQEAEDKVLSSPTFSVRPDSSDLRKITKNIQEAIVDAYAYVSVPKGVSKTLYRGRNRER